MQIADFTADQIQEHLEGFTELLHACVMDGASVSFIHPYERQDAENFWRKKVLDRMEDGKLVVLVALVDGKIAGSVQLDYDTPPNQPHRGDVKKMLVHPDFQRRGIGRALMQSVEETAKARGLRLLTLDTRSGDKGESLYRSSGFEIVGIIPGYSRDARIDVYDDCTFMYKVIG